ncbi:fungal specific transcription factor domain protein [Rhizoctonia solani AG-3 Rhs1AP]|uniref:Fungal specific transcription factor domain protein n=1 Tax=Rhizoctonia solani AG-3 Rhs1AP TaxID=1086054 RepID=X8IXE3_9AGAM|nr:fungal specific transcription factor domain protein [Rhizoctonia solani AG-3 Rhs1AP]
MKAIPVVWVRTAYRWTTQPRKPANQSSRADVDMHARSVDVASLNATDEPNLLQDRIDELQNKIDSIQSSRKNSPRSPPSVRKQHSVPSQNQLPTANGYTEGSYVFSPNEYSRAGPSRSLFSSPSTVPYVADYVVSDSSSSCSSSYGFTFGVDGNCLSNDMNGSTPPSRSPTTAWDTPVFEAGSPQLAESQASHIFESDGSIAAPLAEKITFNFLTHRFRCGLQHIDRLQQHNLNVQRHPALLSAAYLLGCFFCPDGTLASLEPLFVERTRRALEDAIDLTQDFSYAIDYLLASGMLALYYYCKGRLLEGYHRAISAVRFAVNHGFHTIKPLAIDALNMQNPAHVAAMYDQKDKVCAWWFTFFVDRWGSLLTGLPCGIADGDIRTPWPQTLDLQSIIDHIHTSSVSSLYSPDSDIPDRVSSPYYGYALKAMALLDRASVKASSAHTMSPEAWAAEHATIQNALAYFADSVEAIRETSNVEAGTALSFVHIVVYAATCALHMPYIRQWAHDDNYISQRNHLRSICREAASTAAAILRNVRELTVAIIPVWQGLPLAALCEYLLQERDDLIGDLDFTEQTEVDKQLDEMMGWMHDMRSTFPVLGMQVDKLEAKRR